MSGLTYSFVSLGDPGDDAGFQDMPPFYTYTPVPVGGYDGNVIAIQISPKGVMNASGVGGDPYFEIRFRARVR